MNEKVATNQHRLFNVLIAPVVSEKSTFVGEKNNQYVFRVADNSNKAEIKAAVEMIFKVQVEKVSVLSVKGKSKRYGRQEGCRRSWRKAYVCLAEGQELSMMAGEGS